MMKKISMFASISTLFMACALPLFTGCASFPTQADVGVKAVGDSSYRKTYEIFFNTSSNYTWQASATAPAVRSVEMTYGTGVTNVNTFTLTYTRNGCQRDLLSVSGTMHTLTWYVTSDFYPQEGDVWEWSNTASGAAFLTINVTYQY